MPRPEKVQAVAHIRDRIESARAVFLAEYSGLSVGQQQTLRRALKAQEAEFKVVKMSLARLAVAELGIDDVADLLFGPIGLAYADGDPAGAAKTLKDFAKEHDVFRIKGGLLSGELLTPERVSELADIEPRDVLLAKLAGFFAAPMSQVAGLLQGLQQEMAGLIKALLEQKEEHVQPEPHAEPEAETSADAEPEDESPAEAAAPKASGADGPAENAGEEPASGTAAESHAEPEAETSAEEVPEAERSAEA